MPFHFLTIQWDIQYQRLHGYWLAQPKYNIRGRELCARMHIAIVVALLSHTRYKQITYLQLSSLSVDIFGQKMCETKEVKSTADAMFFLR